jgi:hypothetical protein
MERPGLVAAAGEALRGERLAPRVAMLKDLGFQRGTYIQSEDGLIEGGAYLALHNDGYRTMFLGCVSTKETAIEVTAGAFMFKDGASFSVCNRQPYRYTQHSLVRLRFNLPNFLF